MCVCMSINTCTHVFMYVYMYTRVQTDCEEIARSIPDHCTKASGNLSCWWKVLPSVCKTCHICATPCDRAQLNEARLTYICVPELVGWRESLSLRFKAFFPEGVFGTALSPGLGLLLSPVLHVPPAGSGEPLSSLQSLRVGFTGPPLWLGD